MKENRKYLSKRLTAAFLTVCMLVLTLGTAVFAEKGTASLTDDVFLTMEDFTGLGAASGTEFDAAQLSQLSGGMMTNSGTGKFVLNSDNTFTMSRPATVSSNTTYISFGTPLEWDTWSGKVSASIKMKKPASSLADGAEAQGYTNPSIGFYGTDADNTTKGIDAVMFDTDGKHQKINGNSTNSKQDVTVKDIDSDGDGFYEFRIELNKAYGVAATNGENVKYWSIKVYSEESGSEDTEIFWINAGVDSAVGNSYLPNVAGLRFYLYANGTGTKVYSTDMTIADINVGIDRFKAKSADSEIYYDGGSAKVVFSDGLDSSTLSGITMTDAEGNAVPVTVTADGSTASVTPQQALALYETYTIKVANTVKNTAGCFAAPAEFTVRTHNVLYASDFGEWADKYGITVGEPFGETKLESISTMDGWQNAEYILNADGSLTFNNPLEKTSSDVQTKIPFTKPVTYDDVTGDIRVSFGWKAEPVKQADGTNFDGTDTTTGNVWRFISLYNGTTQKRVMTMENKLGTSFARPTGNNWYGAAPSTPVVSDGYYSLEMVISKEYASLNAAGNSAANGGSGPFYDFVWAVRIYDNNDSDKLIGTYRYTKNSDGDNLGTIEGIYVGTYKDGNAKTAFEPVLTLRDIKAGVDRFRAYALESSKIDMNAEALEVEFNYDVDDTTASAVTLTDKNGTDIVTGRSVSGKTVTLAFNGLTYGEDYKLNIGSGLKSTGGYPVAADSFSLKAAYIPADATLFSEDFSAWGVPAGTAIKPANIGSYGTGAITDSNTEQEYYIEDGALAEVKQASTGQHTHETVFNFNRSFTPAQALSDIEICFDYKKEGNMSASTADGKTTFTASSTENGGTRYVTFAGKDSSGSAVNRALFSINGSGAITQITPSGNASSYGQKAPTAATAVGDWYSFKMVVTAGEYNVENKNFVWKVNVYDRNADDKLIYTYYYTADELATLSGFGFKRYQDATSRAAGYLRNVIKNPSAKVLQFKADALASNEIIALGGSVGVSFSSDVKADTVNAGTITITDAAGRNKVTNYSVTGSTVTLTCGTLTVGERYTLNIMYGLKSTKGEDVIPSETVLTAVENPPIFHQDFSELTSGAYTSAQLAAVNSDISATGSFTMEADGEVLKFNATNVSTLSMDVGNISTGTIAADLLIKAEEANSCNRSIHIQTADGGQAYCTFNGANAFVRDAMNSYTAVDGHSFNNPSLVIKEEVVTSGSAAEIATYINVRVVVSRADTSDAWAVVTYDINNDLKPLTMTYLDKTGALKSIGFKINNFSSGGSGTFSVKEVTIRKINDDEVLFGNINSSENYSLKVYTTATDKIAANTVVWNGTIYNRQSDGTYAKAMIAVYDSDDNLITAELLPEKALSYGETKIELGSEVAAADHAKLIIFNNYEDITPLCTVINSTKAS